MGLVFSISNFFIAKTSLANNWRSFSSSYSALVGDFFMPGRPTVWILLHVFLRVGAVTCLVCNFQGLNFKLAIQTILCMYHLSKMDFNIFSYMSYLNYPGSRQKLGTIFETKGLQNLSMRIWKKHHQKWDTLAKLQKFSVLPLKPNLLNKSKSTRIFWLFIVLKVR